MTLFDSGAEPARQSRAATPVGVAEISHDVIREQLSDYLDGSLDDRDRVRVDDHLRYCGSCRTRKRTLEATMRAVGELPREAAPSEARKRLFEIVQSGSEAESPSEPAPAAD